MSKKKKVIIVVFLALVAIFIFLLVYFFLFSPEEEKGGEKKEVEREKVSEGQEEEKKDKNTIIRHEPLNEESCANKKNPEEREWCYLRLEHVNTIKSGNIKDCLNIPSLRERDECIRDTAIRYNYSIELCWSISDIDLRTSCVNSLILRSRNKNFCEKYQNSTITVLESCRDRIGAFLISDDPEKGIEECESLSSLEYPNLCKNRIIEKRYNNDCEQVPEEYKDYCIGITKGIPAISQEDCEEVKLKEYRQYCFSRLEARENNPDDIVILDNDKDGFHDGDELFYGTSINKADTDGDGINDKEELRLGLNPTLSDSDYDGIIDSEDEYKNPHPKTPGDLDGDGLPSQLEEKIGTDPENEDTDGDGVSDRNEWGQGLNPLQEGQALYDSDGDGLIDLDEVFYGTDKFLADTDGDGISDFKEIEQGTNPLGEGKLDLDQDGLSDEEEEKYGTNIYLEDTDGDGYLDGEEIEMGYDPLVE